MRPTFSIMSESIFPLLNSGSLEESAWRRLEELKSVSKYFEGDFSPKKSSKGSIKVDNRKERVGDIIEKSGSKDEDFVCSECGERFKSESELSLHRLRNHEKPSVLKKEEKTGSIFEQVYERAKEEYTRFIENSRETLNETYSRINSYASSFLEEAKERARESYRLEDYFPEVSMEKVSSYELGKGVLGRAFPWKNSIQILDNLYGWLEDKVIEHEIEHVENPWKSEFQVRRDTGTLYLGISTGF